jgi:hypothetical protein
MSNVKRMSITTQFGEVTIVDEPTYTFGSADNVRTYPHARNLSPRSRPVSIHGVLVNEEPLAVFGATGGATGVHDHSAVWLDERLYLAVCDTVVCIQLQPFEVLWSLRVDSATCYGIHFHPETKALLSHGELEITRFAEDGTILWQSGSHEIFTGAFALKQSYIEAEDLEGNQHHFSYSTGERAAEPLRGSDVFQQAALGSGRHSSQTSGMKGAIRQFAIASGSAIVGCAVGYLLFNPLYVIPVTAIPAALVPTLKVVDTYFSNAGAWFVLQAIILFLLTLPNTLFLSAATAAAIQKTALRMRPVLYSTLVTPALLYALYWHDVWRMQRGAAALGLPTEIDRLPINPNMFTNAVFILLTYASYFVFVLAMLRWANRPSAT